MGHMALPAQRSRPLGRIASIASLKGSASRSVATLGAAFSPWIFALALLFCTLRA